LCLLGCRPWSSCRRVRPECSSTSKLLRLTGVDGARVAEGAALTTTMGRYAEKGVA
jgi:hypothetical protein